MNKSYKTIMIVLITAAVFLGLVVLEAGTKILRRAYDDLVLDNKNHYLPCDKLPTEVEVNQVLQEHQQTVEVIEKVNPGFVGLEVDTTTCPGRADLLIWYGTHENRLEIEKIIGGDTFFGIPYRLNNR